MWMLLYPNLHVVMYNYGEYGHHPLKWYFKGEGKLLSDHDHHLSETSAIVVNNGPS